MGEDTYVRVLCRWGIDTYVMRGMVCVGRMFSCIHLSIAPHDSQLPYARPQSGFLTAPTISLHVTYMLPHSCHITSSPGATEKTRPTQIRVYGRGTEQPRARLGFRVPAWWGPGMGDATVVYRCTCVCTYVGGAMNGRMGKWFNCVGRRCSGLLN